MLRATISADIVSSTALQMNMMLELLDVLFKNATSRQSEVVYYKLLGKQEKEIAEMLNVKQHAINQFSSSVGWNAIESAVKAKSLLRFRETDTVKTEYVLVGTLLSFGIAILMGVAVKLLIESNLEI